MRWGLLTIGIVVLVVLIMLISTFSSGITGFAVGESACREIEESSQTLEPYTELRESQVPLQYQILGAEEKLVGNQRVLSLDIQNKDLIEGTFIVRTKVGNQLKEKAESILPGQIVTFTERYENAEDIEYVIQPAKKTVLTTVTKYRTGTQQKKSRKCS